jgi:hypothetical protein
VGSTDFHEDVAVADGLFTLVLDFGTGVFDGNERYLEVSVRPGDSTGSYTVLGSRQLLTAAPYALYALSAGALQGQSVTTTLPSTDQVLKWDGSTWAPGSDEDTTYTAGVGLDLSGTEFSAHGTAYENVVVVAKSGGDYTSVQAAIDSITDAATDNPYLVWVAPGVYSETVTMKPYVHLQGAGQAATTITCSVSSESFVPTQATLVLAGDASLRDLTVGNSGTISNTALLAITGTARTLVADVTALAHGSGFFNSAIVLTGSGTDVTLKDVTALSEGADTHNYGLYIENSVLATVRGGSFAGRGGSFALGICSLGPGTVLEAINATALGEGGSHSSYGLYQDGGTVRLAVTQLDGSFFRPSGTLTCFQVYDGSFAAINCAP